MALRYRPAALLYRLFTALVICTGIIRLAGLWGPEPVGATFTFFTTQSNVLCLVWIVFLVGVTIRDLSRDGSRGLSAPSPRISATVMMAITVTMLVYVVVLAPTAFEQSGGDYQPFGLTDLLVHVFGPLLVVGDWLIFQPKGKLRRFDPLLWTILPYAYVVYVYVWVAAGQDFGEDKRYPYPFLNVDAIGIGGVVLWLVGLTVALVAVGYFYFGLDRLLSRQRDRGTAGISDRVV